MPTNKEFVSTKAFAEAHGIAERTVRNYCAQGKIQGTQRRGKAWLVPTNASLPNRYTARKEVSPLLETLRREKASGMKGGIYHYTQVALTYNSNHIEGSCLTEEQTRYIFETNTIGLTDTVVKVDDIVETANHFRCVDFVIDHAKDPLTERMIKHLHAMLKRSTTDSDKSWFATGDYKRLPNEVGGIETTAPEKVGEAISKLLKAYRAIKKVSLTHILDLHYQFEVIHPFQDGNGRIGRLVMLKECLNHGIVPFIITDELKMLYYRGLRNWPAIKEYLTDTCLTAQDSYKARLEYFQVK